MSGPHSLPSWRRVAGALLLGLSLVVSAPASSLDPLFAEAAGRRATLARALRAPAFRGVETRDGARQTLTDSLNEELTRAARRAAKVLRRHPGTPSVDVVLVGGGIHAGIVAAAVSRQAPGLKVVTIESGPRLGRVFSQSGPLFRINSPELGSMSANILPGAPLQLADLTSARFANADTLGSVVVMNHYASGAVPLLKEKVVEVRPSAGGAVVRTSSGLELKARAVVLATGLGQPNLPCGDPATQQLVHGEAWKPVGLEQAPSLEFFDAALRRAAAVVRAGGDPLAPYRGKSLAVVGAGDAGNVWVELLAGAAPRSAYGTGEVGVDGPIHWVRQQATDHASFVARTKKRYHKPFEALWAAGRFQPHPERLGTVARAGDRYRVRLEGGGSLVVDHVLFCTGYRSIVPQLVQPFGVGSEFQPYRGPAEGIGPSTALAKRLQTSRGPAPVWVIGAGAAPLATDDELDRSLTHNAVSINVLAPRSAGFAVRLVDFLGRPGRR